MFYGGIRRRFVGVAMGAGGRGRSEQRKDGLNGGDGGNGNSGWRGNGVRRRREKSERVINETYSVKECFQIERE